MQLSFTNRFNLLLISFLVLISFQSFSQERRYISSEQSDNSFTVIVNDGAIVFTSYTNSSMEVEFVKSNKVNALGNAVNPLLTKINGTVTQTDSDIFYSSGSLTAIIQKNPFKISYSYNKRYLFSENGGYFDNDSILGFRFALNSTEQLLGGGERVLGMDRRGKRLRLYNKAKYGYETEAELMYYSLPIAISTEKYMLVFDNGADGYMDLGATEKDVLQFEARAGRASYLVVASDEWSSLASRYTELTGRQPMPPRWALGNISSRMGYHSQQEVINVVDGYAANKIPLDGIVLDLYWFGKTLQGTMGELTWYRDSFPNPEVMLSDNLSKGVKTILITEPFILSNSGKYKETSEKGLLATDSVGKPYLYDFYFGNTALLDIFKHETQDWFWSIYKDLTQSGVSGWWGDLGEPEVHPDDINHVNGKGFEVHNIYGHEWAKTVYEGFQKDFPTTRPVILMRSGFAGSQRYGLLPWSGDVSRTWGGLKPQVEISLQMGMQGLGYMSSDLGGFAGDYKDAELYTRWLQYGVFQPVFRTHGQSEVPAEPIFWDDKTKQLAKESIELRYKLLPYNYTLAYENSMLGLPLMRPLFYYDNSPGLIDNSKQYFWGENFMVYPITEKGQQSVSIYMPKGYKWFDFLTKEIYDGGTTVKYKTASNSIPVFVKAGSFIPMSPLVQSTKDYAANSLNLFYYHDESITSSKGYVYEDDGATSKSIENKQFDLVNFVSENNNETLKITSSVTGNEYKGKPSSRIVNISIYNLQSAPKSVIVGDKNLKVKSGCCESPESGLVATWDKKCNTLFFSIELASDAVITSIKK